MAKHRNLKTVLYSIGEVAALSSQFFCCCCFAMHIYYRYGKTTDIYNKIQRLKDKAASIILAAVFFELHHVCSILQIPGHKNHRHFLKTDQKGSQL